MLYSCVLFCLQTNDGFLPVSCSYEFLLLFLPSSVQYPPPPPPPREAAFHFPLDVGFMLCVHSMYIPCLFSLFLFGRTLSHTDKHTDGLLRAMCEPDKNEENIQCTSVLFKKTENDSSKSIKLVAKIIEIKNGRIQSLFVVYVVVVVHTRTQHTHTHTLTYIWACVSVSYFYFFVVALF